MSARCVINDGISGVLLACWERSRDGNEALHWVWLV